MRVAILAAIASLGLLSFQGPARADADSVAKSLPAGAVGVFSLDLRPSSWRFFIQQPELAKWLKTEGPEQFMQDFKDKAGIDPAALMKALGTHLMFAIYPEKDEKLEPPVIGSLELTSPELFQQAVAKLRADKTQTEIKIETYKGVDMIVEQNVEDQSEDAHGNRAAFAMVGSNLIGASREAMLKQLIDTGAAGNGMLAAPGFKEVYQAFGQEQVMVWANPTEFKKVIADDDINMLLFGEGKFGRATQELEINQNFGLGLHLDENGLVVKNLMNLKKDHLTGSQQVFIARFTAKQQPGLENLLAMMPQRPMASALIGGWNLTFDFQSLSGVDAQENPHLADELKEMARMASEFKQATGLDFISDIAGRSDGRAGLSVFYPDRFPTYKEPPAVVAMLGVKDGPGFISNLQKKFAYRDPEAVSDAKVKPTPATVTHEPIETYKDIPIYGFDHSEAMVKALKPNGMPGRIEPCLAVVNSVLLVASNRDALRFSIDYGDKTRQSLLTDGKFNQLRSRMNGQDERNLIYSDLGGWFRLADNYFHGESWFNAARPLLAAFKALAIDNAVNADGSKAHFILDADLKSVDFAKLAQDFAALSDSDAQDDE